MRGMEIDLQSPTYTPGKLLDAAARALGCRSDHDLSRMLEVDKGAICRVRKKECPVSAHMVVQIMDRTNWPIVQVRELMGAPFDGGVITLPEDRRCLPRAVTLSDAQVARIRAATGSQDDIARREGCSQQHVSAIRRGVTRAKPAATA